MELDIDDRYHGSPPCTATMCNGQCEGTGWVPENILGGHQFVRCPDCGGDGKRVRGWWGALTERWHGYTDAFAFAVFWWREYGWSDGHSGGTVGAFRMVWRDTRAFR